jgi:hypothetical protein
VRLIRTPELSGVGDKAILWSVPCSASKAEVIELDRFLSEASEVEQVQRTSAGILVAIVVLLVMTAIGAVFGGRN